MRYDGFENVLNGVGTKLDPTMAYMLTLLNDIPPQMLTAFYEGNKIAERIVSLPADEALKNGFEIEGDEEGLIFEAFEAIDGAKCFSDGLRWMRLYGGCGILVLINDGGLLEEPVNETKIQSIEGIRVYDREEIWYHDMDLYSDPQNPNYGTPKLWYISPYGGTPFYVHESRFLPLWGDATTNAEKVRRRGFGKPVLQGMADSVRNYTQAHHNAFLLLERKAQLVHKMPDMSDHLATDEGEKLIIKRLNLIDASRHILNTLAIDGEETLEVLNIDLIHVKEMLDQFGLALSAESGIPFTVLFGRSPAGMNATGESDLEIWYGLVSHIQERHLRNPIERVSRLMMLAKDGPFKGKELPSWKLKFKALWEPSEKEQAETDKLESEAHKLKSEEMKNYQEAGLMSNIEGRKMMAECQRFKDYINPNLDLSPDDDPEGAKGGGTNGET